MAQLEATRTLVQQKFTEFKVKGNVTGFQPGPVVTVYELACALGVSHMDLLRPHRKRQRN